MVQKLKIIKTKKRNKKLLEEYARRFAEILIDELKRKKDKNNSELCYRVKSDKLNL